MGSFTKRKWKFTKKDFEIVKALQRPGRSLKEIAGITGWSYSTISVASRVDTYKEYCEETTGRIEKSKEKKDSKKKQDKSSNQSEAIDRLSKEVAKLSKNIKWVGKVLKGL